MDSYAETARKVLDLIEALFRRKECKNMRFRLRH